MQVSKDYMFLYAFLWLGIAGGGTSFYLGDKTSGYLILTYKYLLINFKSVINYIFPDDAQVSTWEENFLGRLVRQMENIRIVN